DPPAGHHVRPEALPAYLKGRNGRYTERGIKHLHGYASEQWIVPAGYAVKLDPALGELGVLLEPASVVAKAWEQIARATEMLEASSDRDGIKAVVTLDGR